MSPHARRSLLPLLLLLAGCRDEASLAGALQTARNEAEAAFKNPTVYLEKYIEKPRDVEVQILGDVHGDVIHCWDRDCSVQRRHQKLVEEATASYLPLEVRTKLGDELGLIDQRRFEFCWIVDFPMYELNEDTGQVEFSHNPFSMPQGGMDALLNQDPLTIKAFQYDIVCNGIELSSGAIRNHLPEIRQVVLHQYF